MWVLDVMRLMDKAPDRPLHYPTAAPASTSSPPRRPEWIDRRQCDQPQSQPRHLPQSRPGPGPGQGQGQGYELPASLRVAAVLALSAAARLVHMAGKEVLSALHEAGLSDALRLAEHHALIPRHGDDAAGAPVFPPSPVLQSYRLAGEHLEEAHRLFTGVARLQKEENEERVAAAAAEVAAEAAAEAEALEDAEAEAHANAVALEDAEAEAHANAEEAEAEAEAAAAAAAAEIAEAKVADAEEEEEEEEEAVAEAEAAAEAEVEAKVEVEEVVEMEKRNTTSTGMPTSRGAASFLSPPAGITARRVTRSRCGSQPLSDGIKSDATMTTAPSPALPPPPPPPGSGPGSAGGFLSPTMKRLRGVGAGGAGGGDKRVSFDVPMADTVNANDAPGGSGGGGSSSKAPAIATPAEETEEGHTRKAALRRRLRSSSFGGLN